MGTEMSLVADIFVGTTPETVIEALVATVRSWDPRACYFQQALFRSTDTGDDPQPFYACMRALDAAMGELLLEEFPRGFLQFDKEGRDRDGSNTRWLVFEAVKLVAEFAQRSAR